MKDLDFYTRYAKSILLSLNIPFVDCSVSTNPRLTKNWGYCHYNGCTKTYAITLNPILIDDTVSDDALMNTLLHEYLHTCPKCMRHTGMWKHYAELVNNRYHYNIKRCTSSAEKGIEIETMKYNWAVACPNCNHEWHYQKRAHVIKLAEQNTELGCPYCNRKSKGWKVIDLRK